LIVRAFGGIFNYIKHSVKYQKNKERSKKDRIIYICIVLEAGMYTSCAEFSSEQQAGMCVLTSFVV